MPTVYIVTIDPEPDTGGVGGIEWSPDYPAMFYRFGELSNGNSHDVIGLYGHTLPDELTPEEITVTLDELHWDGDNSFDIRILQHVPPYMREP